MKDLKNHRRHTQRKVLREARQEAQAALLEKEEEPIHEEEQIVDEQMGVEIEEIPLMRRAFPSKDKEWPQKTIPPRNIH